MDGAVQGAQMLSALGYRIICVTSMPARYEGARLQNLQALKFPVEQVIATGRKGIEGNPKLNAILELKPRAFVDDLLHNFGGVDATVHNAFIDYGYVDSPMLD